MGRKWWRDMEKLRGVQPVQGIQRVDGVQWKRERVRG